ncbi:uncharacterized protein E0L32_010501 [Thyridium curvatum]|uniref:Uncharacterized protein n=1 Tax=Thyridium curvatum TaxID=1093900 RepID=A0A507AND0_9PEZI|nr:uncharacterized protein E0L32_010501 [Thyridium curvatum]TPX07814.1 hypothetical protein E0L32_010501 [Thyridium curvatum]
MWWGLPNRIKDGHPYFHDLRQLTWAEERLLSESLGEYGKPNEAEKIDLRDLARDWAAPLGSYMGTDWGDLYARALTEPRTLSDAERRLVLGWPSAEVEEANVRQATAHLESGPLSATELIARTADWDGWRTLALELAGLIANEFNLCSNKEEPVVRHVPTLVSYDIESTRTQQERWAWNAAACVWQDLAAGKPSIYLEERHWVVEDGGEWEDLKPVGRDSQQRLNDMNRLALEYPGLGDWERGHILDQEPFGMVLYVSKELRQAYTRFLEDNPSFWD